MTTGHPTPAELAAAALPVTGEDIRAWLDARNIPVPVGVQTLFAEFRRAATRAAEQAHQSALAGAEQRIEWGIRTTFHDGEHVYYWRGTRQAAEAVLTARARKGWTMPSDLVYRRHLTLPIQVHGQPDTAPPHAPENPPEGD